MHAVALISAFALAIANAASPIEWLGTPYQASTVSNTGKDLTVLGKTVDDAQFLYKKLLPITTNPPPPLTTVFLVNEETGGSWSLQTGFAVLPQNCSCYYLSAKDLYKRFSNLPTNSNRFRIELRTDAGEKWTSGVFGITNGNAPPAPTPPSTPTPGPVSPPSGDNNSTGNNNGTNTNPRKNGGSSNIAQTVLSLGMVTAVFALLV